MRLPKTQLAFFSSITVLTLATTSCGDSDSDEASCIEGCESAANPDACREACEGSGAEDSDASTSGDDAAATPDTGSDDGGPLDATVDDADTTDASDDEDTVSTDTDLTDEGVVPDGGGGRDDALACEETLDCLDLCPPDSAFANCADECASSLGGQSRVRFDAVADCVETQCGGFASDVECWASACVTEFNDCQCPRSCELGCGTSDGCGGTCSCQFTDQCGDDGLCYPRTGESCSAILECMNVYSCATSDASCEAFCLSIGDGEATTTAQYLDECMQNSGCEYWAYAPECAACAADYDLCMTDVVP